MLERTPTRLAQDARSQTYISAPGDQIYLLLLLSFVTALFALQQTGFGLLDYMSATATRLLQLTLVGSMVLMAMLGITYITRLPKFHARIVFALVAINVLYGAISLLFDGVDPLFHAESVAIALGLTVMLGNPALWFTLLRVFFWSGIVLALLNCVPLLYWAGWLHLEPTFIPRLIQSDDDISGMDAYSFGMFGRTESFPVAERFFARLHGWALEPLMWGYFVVLCLACGLMVAKLTPSWRERLCCYCAIAFLAVPLGFIFSASVMFTVASWLLALAMLAAVRRWRWSSQRETEILFLTVVMGVGFLIPFSLSLIPGIQTLIMTEQVIGKGDNWGDKIEFLNLGPELFMRFFPQVQTGPLASHNLVLGMYLHYGYFLVAPLLVMLYWYLRHAVSHLPGGLAAAGLLILLSHLTLVPPAFFYPAGTLFLAIALAAAEYYRRRDTSAS